MFIKIDKSVISLLEKGTLQNISTCFDELFRARRLGNHLIYCTTPDLERIEKTPGLSDSTKLTIRKIKANQRYKKSAFELMSTYINVISTPNTIRRIVENGKNIIEISIDRFANGDFLDATTILAENLTDCDFFQSVTDIINHKNATLRSLLRNAKPLSGGGSQTPRQYRYQKESNNLTICIVDGDIEYQGAPLGTNTAQPIFDDDKNNQVPHCTALILDCYSIENLIPVSAITSAIRKSNKSSYLQKISTYQDQEFWPYIALKQGKKCIDFLGNSPKSAYWAVHKSTFTPSNTACSSWNNGACENPCSILEPMPKETAHKVSEYFLSARKNGQINYLEQSISPLPQQIEALWLKIANTMNSWTCSGARITGF